VRESAVVGLKVGGKERDDPASGGGNVGDRVFQAELADIAELQERELALPRFQRCFYAFREGLRDCVFEVFAGVADPVSVNVLLVGVVGELAVVSDEGFGRLGEVSEEGSSCLLYTSPSPRD